MRGDAAPSSPAAATSASTQPALDEHVVVEQDGVLRAVGERARQPGVGPAGEAAVVAQADDRGAVRGVHPRSVTGLVVDEHAERGWRDRLETAETGAGAFAGAPCDDDRAGGRVPGRRGARERAA